MLPLLLLPQTDEVYKHLSNTKPSTPETTPDKLHAIMAELAPHSDYFFCLAESQKLQYFLPEIFLAALIVGLLFVGAIEIIYKKDFKPTSMLVWRSACAGLLAAAVLYTVQMFDTIPVAPAFSGYLFIAPGLATSKLLVTLSVLLVLYCSESYLREHTRHLLEFSLIVLLAALLLLLLVAANNLMTVFFAIAGFSLAMYILVLFDGYLLPSREAGLKYFYLSALSTGMLLFGIFLVYRTVGSTDYTQIALYLDGVRFRRLSTFLPLEERCLYFGIVFIFFGFMFKLSAFPAHL
jgi:NADH-quinone oxidoreductase subunit N